MVFMIATYTYSCRICVREFYGTDQFGSVGPNDLGPPLNVFDFDQSGHFGWLDRNVPFHLTNCCPQYRSFLYPSYKNNNQTGGGLGRVYATGMYRSIGHVDFPKFQTGIYVEWKVLLIYRVNKSKPVSQVFVSEQSATTLPRTRENIAKTGFCKVVTVCHAFSLLRI